MEDREAKRPKNISDSQLNVRANGAGQSTSSYRGNTLGLLTSDSSWISPRSAQKELETSVREDDLNILNGQALVLDSASVGFSSDLNGVTKYEMETSVILELPMAGQQMAEPANTNKSEDDVSGSMEDLLVVQATEPGSVVARSSSVVNQATTINQVLLGEVLVEPITAAAESTLFPTQASAVQSSAELHFTEAKYGEISYSPSDVINESKTDLDVSDKGMQPVAQNIAKTTSVAAGLSSPGLVKAGSSKHQGKSRKQGLKSGNAAVTPNQEKKVASDFWLVQCEGMMDRTTDKRILKEAVGAVLGSKAKLNDVEGVSEVTLAMEAVSQKAEGAQRGVEGTVFMMSKNDIPVEPRQSERLGKQQSGDEDSIKKAQRRAKIRNLELDPSYLIVWALDEGMGNYTETNPEGVDVERQCQVGMCGETNLQRSWVVV